MSIVLRTNKGSALTYDEMDRNQSQFFYSSSKSPDGSRLRLHYTGSDNLDTTEDYGPSRYHEIAFPTFESEVPDSNVAGDNTQIQFNNNGNFGADPVFVFTNNNHSVGIGTTTPLQRLDVVGDGARGGNIALRGSINHEGEIQSLAGVKFYSGLTDATLLGRVGRIEYSNSTFADDIFIHSGNHDISSGLGPDIDITRSVHISLGNTTPSTSPASRIGATFKRAGNSLIKVGINNTNPGLNLSIVGSNGIGISHTNTDTDDHSRLKPIKSNNSYYAQTSLGIRTLLPDNSIAEGLEISSPNTSNGGNILMVLNTDSAKKEGFNIITTQQSNASTATLLATFQASGRVGIGTNQPAHTGLTVQEQLSVKGLETGTSVNTKTLIATSTGLVKQIAAAPVPLGGIIMWSGAIGDIPDGWTLCNGTGGGNGVTVPNLSNKFIIASNNTTGTPTTTILGTGPTATGGSTSFTPTGDIDINKLTTAMVPRHTHMHLDDDHTYVSNVSGYGPSSPSTAELDKYGGGTGTFNSAADINGYDADSTNGGNRQAFHTGVNTTSVRGTTVQDDTPTVPTGAFTGTTASKAIIPPFYALAYIIYVGV